jgi:phage-related protein
MPSIGPGVREIRVRVRGEHRLIYLANRQRAVYVLHAFRKSSRKTSHGDIEISRARLRKLSERTHGIDP